MTKIIRARNVSACHRSWVLNSRSWVVLFLGLESWVLDLGLQVRGLRTRFFHWLSQSVIDIAYVTVIIKCHRKLQQTVPGITECDSYYKL